MVDVHNPIRFYISGLAPKNAPKGAQIMILRFYSISSDSGLLFHAASLKIPKNIEKSLKTASEVSHIIFGNFKFFAILASRR